MFLGGFSDVAIPYVIAVALRQPLSIKDLRSLTTFGSGCGKILTAAVVCFDLL